MKFKNKMKKIRILFLLFIFIILSGFVRINHQFAYQLAWNKLLITTMPVHCSKDTPKQVQKWAIESIKKVNASAAQVAIYSDNKKYHCEMGWVGKPFFSKHINQNTQFWYASISKLFTAELIFNEIRQYRLSLNTPLVKVLAPQEYLNHPHNIINTITVGHALSHNIGIDREKQIDMMMLEDSWCPNNINKIYSINLDHPPGKYFSYNNLGYCLLGEVVSHLENTHFTQYAHAYFNLKKQKINFIHEKNRLGEVMQKNGITWSPTIRLNLASNGGMRGSALSLAELLKTISLKPNPNIFSLHQYSSIPCNKKRPRGCHGLAMYHFHPKNTYKYSIWKDGSMPGVSAIAIINKNHDVMVFLANSRNEISWKSDNEEIVYQYLRSTK